MMSWGLFTLALLSVYVVQTAGLSHLAPPWLDLLLAMALVCGLAAPAQEARLAGWIVGLAQDFRADSPSPIGLHALALGLAILALTHLRPFVNRELWWVRWLISFAVAFPAQFLVQFHFRFWQHASLSWGQILTGALVPAAVASLLAALLLAVPRALGRRRRRHYSLRRR